jgi:hypothetical protein
LFYLAFLIIISGSYKNFFSMESLSHIRHSDFAEDESELTACHLGQSDSFSKASIMKFSSGSFLCCSEISAGLQPGTEHINELRNKEEF